MLKQDYGNSIYIKEMINLEIQGITQKSWVWSKIVKNGKCAFWAHLMWLYFIENKLKFQQEKLYFCIFTKELSVKKTPPILKEN